MTFMCEVKDIMSVEIRCYFGLLYSDQTDGYRTEKTTATLQILQLNSSSQPRILYNDCEALFCDFN